MSLEDKVEILKRLHAGEGPTSISRDYGVNESCIRNVRKKEENVYKELNSISNGSAKKGKLSYNARLFRCKLNY